MKTIQMFAGKAPAFLLLIGAVVLMQKHAWEFWSQYDPAFGPLWAVMLEGAALWLWSQRSIAKNALALVASVLVLAGPLYEVSKPAVEMWQQSQVPVADQAAKKQRLIDDLAGLKAGLKTYEANSENRGGWLPAINQAKHDITAKDAELNALEKSINAPVMPWQALTVIGMQLVALLIFQALIVLCIRAVTQPVSAVSEQKKALAITAKTKAPNQTAKKPASKKLAQPKANGKTSDDVLQEILEMAKKPSANTTGLNVAA